MREQRRQYTPEEALQYAAALCARCEQCEFDIRRKLSDRGLSLQEADKIINYLYDNRFLDEERFATAFTRDKMRFSNWGKRKIRAHLQAKRVSSESITVAMQSVDTEEYAAIVGALAKRLAKGCDLTDFTSRQKLLRKLASRGVEADLAIRAIERLTYCEQ